MSGFNIEDLLVSESIYSRRQDTLCEDICRSPVDKCREEVLTDTTDKEDYLLIEQLVIQKQIEQLRDSLDSGKYSSIELNILKALYIYEYLNIFNITRYMKHILPDYIKKTDFTYNVKRLYKDGYLCIFEYPDTKGFRAYGLTKPAYKYIASLGKTYKTHNYVDTSILRNVDLEIGSGVSEGNTVYEKQCLREEQLTDYILERLSISQFHIGAVCSGRVFGTKYMYKRVYSDYYVTIPSMCSLKSVLSGKGEVVTLFTLPTCKSFSEKNISLLARKVFMVCSYVSEHLDDYSHPLICFTVDSEKTSVQISKILLSNEHTKDLPICYILDSSSVKEDMFSYIYLLNIIDDNHYSKSRLGL